MAKSPVKRVGYFVPLAVLLIVLWAAIATQGHGQVNPSIQASFIDVGQGDCIWLHSADGTNVLVDGGPSQAGPTVVAYLRRQGIDDIDALVVSHAHTDHFGGLVDVLRSTIPVESVIYNGETVSDTTDAKLLEQMRLRGLTPTPAHAGQSFQWGTVSAEVLNPQATPTTDQNENSIVLLIESGGNRILLTGDIGTETEQRILASGEALGADVLKVAHHGGKYSSGADFLGAVHPSAGVISVGVNSYSDPSPGVIDRLAAAGAHVFRTDQGGTVVIALPLPPGGPVIGYRSYLPYSARPPAAPTPTVLPPLERRPR